MKEILLLEALFFCFLQSSYAQPGKLDTSFGTNGIVVADVGKQYNYGGITKKVLSQTDGSSYTVLDLSGQTVITKLLSNGSIDENYGQNGFSAFSGISPTNAALQQDGKIVVAGNTIGSFGVTRFNTDGSIDTGFSSSAIKSENFGADYSATKAVAVQSDGKIVLGGAMGQDSADTNLTIVRLNADGSVDTTFGYKGEQSYYLEGDASANSIVISNDNKIIVSVSHYLDYTHSDFTLLRYNTDGRLDSSFSEDGIQTTSFTVENGNSLESVISSTIIQPDGKIVATGHSNINNQPFVCLARYNVDGTLDKGFSNDGKQTTHLIDSNSTVAIQDDGKIVVSGSASLSRYNTNGSLDLTFNMNGIQTTDFPIASIVIQSGKKILSAGNLLNTADNNFALARYNSNGSIDNTFSGDGKFVSNFKDRNTIYTNSAIQKDTKVVSVGRTWNGNNFDFIISRYNFDGSTDNTFHSDGNQTADFSSKDDYADAVAIQNDGKIVVGGHSIKNNSSGFSVARYNTDGSLDNTFNNSGSINVSIDSEENVIESVIIQKDGKILLAGSALIRLNTNGSLDNTFNHNGILNPPFTTHQAVMQSDGKIVVAAIYNNSFSVARFNTNGSIDTSFSQDGIQTRNFYDYYDQVNPSIAYSVAVQDDGKIIAGGHCNCKDRFSFNLYSSAILNRFNTDGSFDYTFSAFDSQGFDNSGFVNLIAVKNDGKIMITDIPNHRFQLLNSMGNTDPDFRATQGAYNLNSLKIANNKFYTTGYTTPVRRGVVARYSLDDEIRTPPTVNLTTPANKATYLAPAAHIKLTAAAADKDGTISKVEFYNGTTLLHTETLAPYGFVWRNVPLGNYTITAKAYDNSRLVTTSAPVHISVVPNKPPTVSIVIPFNNQSYPAPATIHLEAAAKDPDGRITKVEFYNGSTLLQTELKPPYTFAWRNVPVGNYAITAKATDNWGAVTTSAVIRVSVHPNIAPTVSITAPANGEGFAAPATIDLAASAQDPDGRITKVEFYNGTVLLRTERKLPYSYHWQNVPAGTYTITAVTTDNYGLETTSAAVKVTVTNAMIVSSRPYAKNDKTALNDALQLNVFPNPARDIVNITTKGLQRDAPAILSVLSASGVVAKTMQLKGFNQTVQMNVSSLNSGVYTIKLTGGSKILYKQFVKL